MADSKRKLEQQLAQAVREETPDLLPQILSARQLQKGRIIDMTQELQKQKQKKNHVRNWAIAAAAALVLAVGGFAGYQYQFAVDTAVSIDVNPSIRLEVNRQEKILSANALNDDAEKILDGMELNGTNLKTAVNAIIGSMVQNGYLTNDSNSILLTVDNDDAAKREALQKELMADVNASLESLSMTGTVFSQSLSTNDQILALAKQYNISEGKAAWIQALVTADSTLSADTLAELSINDLALLAEGRGLKNEVMGTADESGYIGAEKAEAIAIEKAGGGTLTSIELDLEDGVMVYEGELVKDGVEYEFDINAQTGEIIKWEAEKAEQDKTPSSSDIGLEKAKSLVLQKIPGATITEIKLDVDDGVRKYEGEAILNSVEYEFEIKASDGTFLKWEEEKKQSSAANTNTNNNNSNNNNTTAQPTTKPTTKPTAKPTTKPSSITMDDARNLVLNKVSGATITQLEVDYEDGRKVYEGEAYKGNIEYEFEIDASTGKFIKWEQDVMDDDDRDDKPADSSGLITEAKAREVVLNKLPGGTIVSIELDEDDGIYTYEGEVRKDGVEYEFTVNAKTGSIIEWERDD
ncbi:MAG TPA: PepSY domain-containing protein [Candidatus Gallacutalibacter pullistercoris]|nr:PepSY domain-containing protein [Candidatus Gallacutalibacter pullistercoris]